MGEREHEEADGPRPGEPGWGSTPQDAGRGVVDVGDRTGDGAPAANQPSTQDAPPAPEPDSRGGELDTPAAASGAAAEDREPGRLDATDPQGPERR